MKNLLIKFSCLFIFISSYVGDVFADGFQGLPWGSKPIYVTKKFPSAREEQSGVLKNTFVECDGKNGDRYKCSVADRLCQSMGIGCFPSLKLSNYMVGSIPFDLTFGFSKANQLSEVTLTHSNVFLNATTFEIRSIYNELLNNLQLKYGSPFYQEKYLEQMGAQCQIKGTCMAFGLTDWRTKDTRIRLQFVGTFDPETHKFVDIGSKSELTISYQPVVNEAASKM